MPRKSQEQPEESNEEKNNDQPEQKSAPAPKVGAGSAPGERWFVCRFPDMKFTVEPGREREVKGEIVKEKGVYATFQKQVKPERYQGDGMLGSRNRTGTDKNDSPWWGVYYCIVPSDEEVKAILAKREQGEKLLRKEREKINTKEIVDFLREHEYFRKTVQDDMCESKPWLKELTWDPRTLGDSGPGLVQRRGFMRDAQPTESAPVDSRPQATKARVATMG